MRELYYKATVDGNEWEVSSIEVTDEEKWKLKDLRAALLSENLLDDKSTVAFYRSDSPPTKQLAFTTKVQYILQNNGAETPLCADIVTPESSTKRHA